MTPMTIITRASADGVRLALSPAGTIKAVGARGAVVKWLPAIRRHKPAIIAVLKARSQWHVEAASQAARDARPTGCWLH